MNKEFIPYEQALALKELGFDEPCFATYNTDKKVSRNPSHNMEDLPIEGQPYYWNNSKIHKDVVTAPLYQQAFRWFREKYNLDSFVKHLYKSTIKVGYYFGIDEYKGIQFQMGLDAWYNTYEEAELACLIKLIEIVKNK
jgi:hypothetical protein